MAPSTPGAQPYGTSIIQSGPVDFTQAINHDNIRGKTIVITGGASGFGAACFAKWALHGANVIIGDVNETAGTELVAQLRASTNNQNHHFIRLDVTSWTSQTAFFKQAATLSPHGGIDHVMANAGVAITPENEFFEEPPDYLNIENPPPPAHRTLDINLNGVILTTHLALAYLSRNPGSDKVKVGEHTGQRDRHLILVASIAGFSPLPTLPYYAAAKHGVVGLWRTLRLTTPIKHGVRVNMINPCEFYVLPSLLESQYRFCGATGTLYATSADEECNYRFRRYPYTRCGRESSPCRRRNGREGRRYRGSY